MCVYVCVCIRLKSLHICTHIWNYFKINFYKFYKRTTRFDLLFQTSFKFEMII